MSYRFRNPIMALSSSSSSSTTTMGIKIPPHEQPPPRVKACIVGGGVGGCTAAASLLSNNNHNIHVMMLEMGRGVGGRASTRFSRDDPRLAINHGAPHADIQTKEGLEIMKELEKGGFAKQSSMTNYWMGNPNMNRICEGLLDSCLLPNKNNKLDYLFRSMVRAVEPIMTPGQRTVEGWFLKDKDGKTLVETEWLIVAGSGMAHPRWTTAFGGEPPLLKAAKAIDIRELNSALETIGSVHSRPVQAALMAFEVRTDNATSPIWKRIIATEESNVVMETPGDSILEKLVLQKSVDGSCVSIVAHSNDKFAESVKDVYGSKSTAARIGGAISSAEREQEVLDLLMNAVQRILISTLSDNDDDDDSLSSQRCPEPSWGPFLHRWGNAFPEGLSLPLENALIEDAKIAFCGDYVGDQNRFGTFEGALVSGTKVGEQLRHILLAEEGISVDR